MKERSGVRLSKREQEELRRLLQSGLQPVRTVLRRLINKIPFFGNWPMA